MLSKISSFSKNTLISTLHKNINFKFCYLPEKKKKEIKDEYTKL